MKGTMTMIYFKRLARLRAWLTARGPDLGVLVALLLCIGIGLYNYAKHHDRRVRAERRGEWQRACERDKDRCSELVPRLEGDCGAGSDGDACWYLALLLRNGRGMPRDEVRAHQFFQRACSLGLPEACGDVGTKDPGPSRRPASAPQAGSQTPACANARLVEEAMATGKRLRVCPHDDPATDCIHESPPPGPHPAPYDDVAGQAGLDAVLDRVLDDRGLGGESPPTPDRGPLTGGGLGLSRPHHYGQQTGADSGSYSTKGGGRLSTMEPPGRHPVASGDDAADQADKPGPEPQESHHADLLSRAGSRFDPRPTEEELACRRARAPFQADLPGAYQPHHEFASCRALALSLLDDARRAKALAPKDRSLQQSLAPLPYMARAAFREACRYNDGPACIHYALLRQGGYPSGQPSREDVDKGRSALRRGCKLTEMQYGAVFRVCIEDDVRPVRGKPVCEPHIDDLDDDGRMAPLADCIGEIKPPPPGPPPPPTHAEIPR